MIRSLRLEINSAITGVEIKSVAELESPMLGATSPGLKDCAICDGKRCFGHSGYIQLNELVCMPLFIKEIERVLSGFCVRCMLNSRTNVCRKCNNELKRCKLYDNTPLDKAKSYLEIIGSPLQHCISDRIPVPPRMLYPLLITNSQEKHLSYYNKLVEACTSNKHKRIINEYNNIILSDRLCVSSSLKGKDGLFRELMIGKRVNYCGRAVIVGSDTQDVNVVSLPNKIYKRIRPLITINETNLDYALTLSSQGKLYTDDNVKVHIGSVIDGRTYRREISSADTILLNRQPSLTKGSISGFRVIKNNTNAIILNTAVTGSFGADFDGDEMNVFYIGDNVPDILIDNKPEYISFIQDTITTYYSLTLRPRSVSRSLFNDCIMITDRYDIPYTEGTDTLQLLSLPLPRYLSYDGSCSIVNGIITKGYIDKKTLSNLVRIVSVCDDVVSFVGKVHRVVSLINMVLTTHSIRFNDIYLRSINVDDIYNEYEGYDDLTDEELSIISDNVVSKAYDMIISNSNINNSIRDMIDSGAKGNIDNAMEMSVTLGYQKVSGRVLGNGLCKSSYIRGLSSKEFFYHMMSSREGVVHTNVKVSDVGYAGRKLCKILSNTIIDSDYNISELGDVICRYGPGISVDTNVLHNL